MKNRFLTFYSILISIIFIFSLSFFTLNLIYEYSHGLERTKRRFDHLENVINTASNQKQIENAIGNLNDFSYLKIEMNSDTIFIYPSVLSIQNPETNLVKNYTTTNKSNKFYIEASLYTLRPATIHYYAKISFLIIILATTITLIIIICIALNDNESKSNVKFEEIEELQEDSGDQIQINNEDNNVINQIETDENQIENTIETHIDIPDENENKTEETRELELSSEKNEIISLPEDHSKPINIVNKSNSLNTIKSAEELLELRLEKELNRAISSEVDLSLFLIRIPEITQESAIYQDIMSKLTEDFQYRDLIFEVNKDCFAAIKLNTTIDDALNFADTLNHSINNIIAIENKICFIGIAARTLRMVSAKRLVYESKEALVHAQQDSDTPIVAFKVDAEKYMRMMENE